MQIREELHKIAKRCADILRDKYRVKRVVLIGSLIKGVIHERSDIDLVVEGLEPSLYITALTDLWDILPKGVELNLITFEDAFDSLKEKAVKEGKYIYGFELKWNKIKPLCLRLDEVYNRLKISLVGFFK